MKVRRGCAARQDFVFAGRSREEKGTGPLLAGKTNSFKFTELCFVINFYALLRC